MGWVGLGWVESERLPRFRPSLTLETNREGQSDNELQGATTSSSVSSDQRWVGASVGAVMGDGRWHTVKSNPFRARLTRRSAGNRCGDAVVQRNSGARTKRPLELHVSAEGPALCGPIETNNGRHGEAISSFGQKHRAIGLMWSEQPRGLAVTEAPKPHV